MSDMFSMQGPEKHISSASQLKELAEMIQRQAQERAIKRKGAEAQIESSKILADQREEMEQMRNAINSLLKHSLEQAEQQSIAKEKRDKIEAERFRENIRWTKIAAWSGIVATIFAVVTITLQVFQ